MLKKRKKSVNILSNDQIFRPKLDDETNDLINDLNAEVLILKSLLQEANDEIEKLKKVKETKAVKDTKKLKPYIHTYPMYQVYYMYIPIYQVYPQYLNTYPIYN